MVWFSNGQALAMAFQNQNIQNMDIFVKISNDF